MKIGLIKKAGILCGGYQICEWATRDWMAANHPDWTEGLLLPEN